jgi:hypothetical protein
MEFQAYCNHAIVEFDIKENAEKAFREFSEFVQKANWGELKGHYCIYNVNYFDKDWEIRFSAESPKFQNLEWQVKQILEFFKKQEGCLSFGAQILTESNRIFWKKG